ncbi:MAG: hypothetical protein GY870_13840 [archaeon]|nr:hypothetical protein [archaeon]
MGKNKTKSKKKDIQITILNNLINKSQLQSELHISVKAELGKEISKQNFSYHLKKLEEKSLILKIKTEEWGAAHKNRISINPMKRQYIRTLISNEINNYTLITGFGFIKKGYLIPDISYKELKKFGYNIDRVVCFTSKDARRKRKTAEEQLIKINKYYDKYEYEKDYCNINSELYSNLEEILKKEIKSNNVIIDLTPLSKLFSFKLLELCNKYNLPCFFLGMGPDNTSHMIGMSTMKISGKMQHF